MSNFTRNDDSTTPSAQFYETPVHDSAVIPLAQLVDSFQDKNQQTLSNFYKGSPPKWVDYFTAEENNTPLVKRDVYDDLIQQIKKCQKMNCAVSSINFSHHPGSGGSTLAMQVLWDLRSDFKCAIIKHGTAEATVIAGQSVQLFEEGDSLDKRTLLLLNDNVSEEDLMESLNQEIAKKEFSPTVPIAILLNAKRQTTNRAKDFLNLKNEMSFTELHNFELQEAEMKLKHSDEEMKQFHGFNLMKNNFSEEYVASLSSIQKVKEYVRGHKTACSTELFSVLALLNSYVPGSFLPISRCLDILAPEHSVSEQDTLTTPLDLPDLKLQVEKDMEPFMDLIVIFSRDEVKSECVRLAHPMIANECLKALAKADITKGEIAKRFLESCKPKEPPYMVKIIKSLLIKREIVDEFQKGFSRLILDLQDEHDTTMCKQLFEIATNTFEQDAFFPQAFARFLYLVFRDYDGAEHQAVVAIDRDPENSFLRDTLGQIHKHHLKDKLKDQKVRASEIFEVADLAIRAFGDAEKAAENEQDPNSSTAQPKKISQAFNCRGLFGYIQVAKMVFETLTALDQKWNYILTGEKSIEVLGLAEAQNLLQYQDLIVNLRKNVEKKHAFFETYLTYSKPSRYKSEPPYFQADVESCYNMYLLRHSKPGVSTRSVMDRSFAGLFSCIRLCASSFIERLTEHTKKIFEGDQSNVDAAVNYIFSNIILSNTDDTSRVLQTLKDLRAILWRFVDEKNIHQSPEFFLLVLLLFWPDENQDQPLHYELDLSNVAENMKAAFDQKYLKHFRSRYLRPLFFLGQGTGLKRLVHSWKIFHAHKKDRTVHVQKKQTWDTLDWGSGNMWRDHSVQSLLLRVSGVFKKQQLFAYVGDKEIPVYTDQSFVSCQGSASFFLGFTIKGPVAYDITFQGEETQEDKYLEMPRMLIVMLLFVIQDLTDCSVILPETVASSVNENMKYRVKAAPGIYECGITGIRWESSCDVELEYCWSNWDLVGEFLKTEQYCPCGPLLNINVISGRLKAVHLPHFLCLGSGQSLDDEVRVCHVTGDRICLERCTLTRFHATLLIPTLCLMGLVKRLLRRKIHCKILIYHVLNAAQTFRIYLIPDDKKSKEAVEKEERGKCVKISKPNPESSMEMKKSYKLKTLEETKKMDCDSEIMPTSLKLRYPVRTPNFFEVYISNPTQNFYLQMMDEDNAVVWEVKIRKDDFNQVPRSEGVQEHSSEEYGVWFVSKYRTDLIERVSYVNPIADDLKDSLGDIKYKKITNKSITSDDQMRELYNCLSAEPDLKKRFYESLQKREPFLVNSLQKQNGS
ncbi:sterile alpha motif domain-containing protein 9-like isoform X1 [Astyanax mexicanus]|uniref:Sterile alpha motif domain-containing protein 9-like isoform X1 n=1 Tax=Astyanax mexicanus TaxID=7994 RepID=A0A8T2KJS8_ASTMX|nr:sterile alpha motif domain-containing protein 9-like isoform X1 [Astyanax mexicanus]